MNVTEAADEILAEPDLDSDLDVSSGTEPTTLSDDEIKKLVIDNIKLAYFFAHKYKNIPNADQEDIESQAMAGLVKAANTYKPEKGKFSHWASSIIRNYMNHAFHVEGDKAAHEETTLDAPASSEDDTESRIDKIGADDATSADQDLSKADAIGLVRAAIEELDPIEKAIIQRKMAGESYRDMQSAFGVSFVQIGNIVRKAFSKMQAMLADKGISGLQDILGESALADGKKVYDQLMAEVTLSKAMSNLSEADRCQLSKIV
jgi:RNA polymerase sigma factor (sigma-70 family)